MSVSETGSIDSITESPQAQERLEAIDASKASQQHLFSEIETDWTDIPVPAQEWLLDVKNCAPGFVAQTRDVFRQFINLDASLADLKGTDLNEFMGICLTEASKISELDKGLSGDTVSIAENGGANEERRATIDVLRNLETIAEEQGLTGRAYLRFALEYIDDENIPAAARENLQWRFEHIVETVNGMSQVFTDKSSQAAFEDILNPSPFDFVAPSPMDTLMPIYRKVEASAAFTDQEKKRLRMIMMGSQAQSLLKDTVTTPDGRRTPAWTEDQPLIIRDGTTMYADANMNQYMVAEYNSHKTEIDVTGWSGEVVGKYLEAMSFMHDMESYGATGFLHSVYQIDYNLFGNEGLDMHKVNQILNIMGLIFGGFEHADGDIRRDGERRGYIQYLARLLNKRNTATGFEESQVDMNEVIDALKLHNENGTPNWKQLERMSAFAQRYYLTGDVDFYDLEEHLVGDNTWRKTG